MLHTPTPEFLACFKAFVLYVTVGLLFLNGPACARDDKAAVVLVKVSYEAGTWAAEAMEALPCQAPSRPESRSRASSLYRLVDAQGCAVFERTIVNPRILVVEDPDEPTRFLDELDFILAVPLDSEATRFEFYESIPRRLAAEVERRDEGRCVSGLRPSTTVSVEAAIREFVEDPGRRRDALCLKAEPDLGHLPDLQAGEGEVLTLTDLVRLLEHDPATLSARGIKLGLHPDELSRLLAEARETRSGMSMDQGDVDEFLKRYEREFSRAGNQ